MNKSVLRRKKSCSFTSKRSYRRLKNREFEKHKARFLKWLKNPTYKNRPNGSLNYRIKRKILRNQNGKRQRHKDSRSSIPRVSEAKWQRHEIKTQQEQKQFLEGYSKHFKKVQVSSHTKNVRQGDHIFYRGSASRFYNHHLLCTDVDKDGIIYVIEYSGNGLGFLSPSRSAADSNIFAVAEVKTVIFTHQELENKQAKIRKWPEGLQRFSVKEVIERAFSRIGERDYHAFNNNCEHFVTWCKCGLNTSLQVKPWYKLMWHAVKCPGCVVISQSIPSSLRVAGMFLGELPEVAFSALSPVGLVAVGVTECGLAGYSVWKDYKRMKEKRLSKKQFKINLVFTGSKAFFRTAGSIAGSVIGSAFGPVGSIVGGVLGYCAGHVAGLAVNSCIENAPKIKKTFQDHVVSPVKKMVNSVKTASRRIGKGIKTLTKRDR